MRKYFWMMILSLLLMAGHRLQANPIGLGFDEAPPPPKKETSRFHKPAVIAVGVGSSVVLLFGGLWVVRRSRSTNKK